MGEQSILNLLAGATNFLCIAPDGELSFAPPQHAVILSGSFNPLHEGHLALANAAAGLVNRAPYFELAVVNADKGTIAMEEIEQRAAQFANRYPLLLSREPLFTRKAPLYPGSDFALGYDTAARLIEPRYYGGPAGLTEALSLVRDHGCRFIVAGRLFNDRFRTLSDLTIPPGFADLFLDLPESSFRVDLSSSELRTQNSKLSTQNSPS
jgi:hypothetical protein